MLLLIVGLVLFLGAHSVRIVAEQWRSDVIARRGEKRYKGIYSLISAAGLVLIVIGYGLARQTPVLLWTPPLWGAHLNWLLTFVAFLIIPQANGPVGPVKAVLHHPMAIAVALWAFGHLLANGTLADLLLFGGFLVWSLSSWRMAARRDSLAGTTYEAGSWGPDIGRAAAGALLWLLFYFVAHDWLIGVGARG